MITVPLWLLITLEIFLLNKYWSNIERFIRGLFRDKTIGKAVKRAYTRKSLDKREAQSDILPKPGRNRGRPRAITKKDLLLACEECCFDIDKMAGNMYSGISSGMIRKFALATGVTIEKDIVLKIWAWHSNRMRSKTWLDIVPYDPKRIRQIIEDFIQTFR